MLLCLVLPSPFFGGWILSMCIFFAASEVNKNPNQLFTISLYFVFEFKSIFFFRISAKGRDALGI